MKHKKKPEEVSSSSVCEQKEIADWLNTVKFQHVRFGGIDEADVWKKIEELNRMYEKMLIAERSKYETLIRTYCKPNASAREKSDE